MTKDVPLSTREAKVLLKLLMYNCSWGDLVVSQELRDKDECRELYKKLKEAAGEEHASAIHQDG